jgi:hypothetical protein
MSIKNHVQLVIFVPLELKCPIHRMLVKTEVLAREVNNVQLVQVYLKIARMELTKIELYPRHVKVVQKVITAKMELKQNV